MAYSKVNDYEYSKCQIQIIYYVSYVVWDKIKE
jgi:hypothetical protein